MMLAAHLGNALAVACADPAVLAHIAGPIGDAARAAAASLAPLAPAERRVQRATWAALARAPIPPGLRAIDGTWIEAALLDLPVQAREAIAGAKLDPASVWLARWACATLPPMPAIDPAAVAPVPVFDARSLPGSAGPTRAATTTTATTTTGTTIAAATTLPALALRAWLEDLGAEQLAFALGDPKAIAGAAAIVGERLTAASTRIVGDLERLGSRRAAIGRCKVTLDDQALFVIGIRTVIQALDPLERRQLLHRLPLHVVRRSLTI